MRVARALGAASCDAARSTRARSATAASRVREHEFRYRDRAGLRRPRRAAGAARRPRSSRAGPASCASAAATTSATRRVPLADAVRALVARAHRARARRARPPAHPPAHARALLQPGQLLLLLRRRRRARSRRSSPRSPTRRGASATPTCCRARRRRGARGGSTRRCTSRRSWAWTSATPGARPRPATTLSVHIESQRGRRARVRRHAALQPPRADRRTLAACCRATRRRRCASLALIYGHAVAPEAQGRPRPSRTPAADDRAHRARASSCALLRPHRASASSRSSRAARATVVRRAARPQATVARPRPAASGARSCAAAAAWASAYIDGLWDSPDLDRGDPRRRAQRRRASTSSAAGCSPVREPFQRARAAFVRNTPRRSRKRHRRPLRPRQRPVRADARPDDDVLVRRSSSAATRRSRRRRSPSSSASARSSTSARATTCSRSAPAGAASRSTPRRTRGCRVTTTTISREQHDYAVAARARGRRSRTASTVLLDDYRDLRGHLRQARLDRDDRGGRLAATSARSSSAARDLLAPDGAMLLQAITIDDRAYDGREGVARASSARSSSPAAACRRCEVIARCVARRTDLRTVAPRGPHAALRRDAAPLARELRGARRTQLEALGYDERFRRLWRLYLCYCEAGFAERRIGARADRARQAAGRRRRARRGAAGAG